jgi:hypothetical protein
MTPLARRTAKREDWRRIGGPTAGTSRQGLSDARLRGEIA